MRENNIHKPITGKHFYGNSRKILNFEYYSFKNVKCIIKILWRIPSDQWLRLHASSAYKAVGMGAQSLVRLLRFHMLHGATQKKQKKKARIRDFLVVQYLDLPTSAGEIRSIPGPGTFHMLQGN